MQRKVLHSDRYWICFGPIWGNILLLFLLLLLKRSIMLPSLMDTAKILVIVQAQTTFWERHRAQNTLCARLMCSCKVGSHAAQRLQNAGKHLNQDLLPKHERPRKLSTKCNTLSFVCVPANINATWSLNLKWKLNVARSNSRTLHLAS